MSPKLNWTPYWQTDNCKIVQLWLQNQPKTITGLLDNCSFLGNESNSTLDSLKQLLLQESIRKSIMSTSVFFFMQLWENNIFPPFLQVWKDYFPAVDAIVFLIDSCDRGRFNESKVELDSLLTDEQLSNCPVMVLGNKIDRPGAASEDELRQIFGLYGQTTGKGKVPRSELHGRPLELFMCSVLKRQGYGEGFRWISQYLD